MRCNINTELSNTEIKILKFFRDPRIGLNRPYVSAEVVQSHFRLTLSMANHCLDNLLRGGFAKIDTLHDEATYYQITEQDSLYLEKIRYKLKSKIIWSMVVPIAVSAITSLIITMLSF